MDDCRLILVEGIPGSGKTTLAAHLHERLVSRGLPARLYGEGDVDHPADFESVAHFSRADYADLLGRHAAQQPLLERYALLQGDDCFVAYGRLRRDEASAAPEALLGELARRDVYETPLADTYCRLIVERWMRFARQAASGAEVFVFECCFLQNPLTVLIGKHNQGREAASRLIHALAAAIQPLRPALVYLWQPDARAALERIAAERPREWREHVTGYFTGQGWGRAAGLSGFDGVIAFYEMRQRLELDVLPALGLAQLVVDRSRSDWEADRAAAGAFLDAHIGRTP
jgi:hypothetical protein